MAEYHVMRGLAGIYAGTLKKNGEEWQNKTDVTSEAIREVALYLLENDLEVRIGSRNGLYLLKVESIRKWEEPDHVKAWMPLPKPYEERRANNERSN